MRRTRKGELYDARQRIRVVVRLDLRIRRGDEALRRVGEGGQCIEGHKPLPFMLARPAGHRAAAVARRADRRAPDELIADMVLAVREDEIERGDGDVGAGGAELVRRLRARIRLSRPVISSAPSCPTHLRASARSSSFASPSPVTIGPWRVMRVSCGFGVLLPPDRDDIHDAIHQRPAVFGAVAEPVVGIDLLDVEIGLHEHRRRDAPGDTIVVADGDAGHAGDRRARRVDARRGQVALVPDGGDP